MDSHQEKKDLSREEIRDQIVNSLEDNVNGVSRSRVVLVGEAGIGKTWLAREICKLATEDKGSCYLALWFHLNKKFDETSLYQNLAAQLSLFSAYEECDADDREKTEKENVEELKKKITEELKKKKNPGENEKSPAEEEKKSGAKERKSNEEVKKLAEEKEMASSAGKKYLLLILEDEGSMTKEETVMKDLKLQQFLENHGHMKILITRGNRKGDDEKDAIMIPPLTDNESRVLLKDSQKILDSLTEKDWEASLKSLHENKEIDDPTLMSCIIRKSMGLPAAIVTLAKSLSRVKRNSSKEVSLSKEQKKAIKELILSSKSSDAAAGSKSAIDPSRYNPVLCLAYALLRNDDALKSATVACFWHSLDFFKHCGCIYYRDLIVQWILEGYFDPVKSVEEAYGDGHTILMELIDRGFLKIQEDNVVVPEMAMSNLIDLQDCGLFGRSRLGFASVYGGDKTKGLGKITQVDDMIKTVPPQKQMKRKKQSKEEKLSTILISGNRLRRETPSNFFEEPNLQDLEVLCLFDPTFHYLVPSLPKLKKLRVLVIRDYDLLESINELASLQELQVLEVSGASSLKNISDEFFKNMPQLQSLNLSGLRIKSSPSTISQLSELCCLIMRDCPELEDLPDVQSLTKLQVIDIHGAQELKTCFDKVKGKDKNKSKNKNFAHLQTLQHLDLSGSQVDRLPIFQDSVANFKTLSSLTQLLLRDCNKLKRLPILRPLSGLQILDLSGATSLQEMYEVCFESKEKLRILNLSGTGLRELPDTISGLSNLSQFLLRDCPNLEALPNIKTLTNLEVFDVSGCTKLEKIKGSFEHMCYLRELNLSGTKLKTLPELPKQSGLCSSKRIFLPDSRRWEDDDWSKIEEGLKSSRAISDHEILEKMSEPGEKKADEPQACICPEKKGECKELIHQGDIYKPVYLKTRQFVDPESKQEIIEIHGSDDPSGFSDHDKKTIAKAEFVSFVDNNHSASVSSIFHAFQMKSVKGCWVERCKKMETLLSGEDEKHVESLQSLWISNLPILNSICSESLPPNGFKNLEKLSVDCCPRIKTLFPASHLPNNLKILRITFCDNLEKVFEKEGEAPNLRTLYLLELPMLSTIGAKSLPNLETFTKEKCPKLKGYIEMLK